MYSAVYWMKHKNWSIISSDTIREGDVKPGCMAYALWKDKLEEVRILRCADDFDDLKSIKVTKDGYLRDFGMDKALLDTPATSSKTKQKATRSKPKPGPQLKPVDDSTQENEAGTLAKINDVMDSVDDVTVSNVTESPNILNAPDTDDQARALPLVLPPASPEVINFLEVLAENLKMQLQGNSVVLAGSFDAKNLSTRSPGTHDSSTSDSKVELLLGHPVVISRKSRSFITKLNKTDPEQMVRDLLIAIIGVDQLKGMKARNKKGTSNFKPIGKEVMKAIEEYVALHAKPLLPKTKVTKVVNNLCNTLRNPVRPHKRSPDGEGGGVAPDKPKKRRTKKGKSPKEDAAATSPWKVMPSPSLLVQRKEGNTSSDSSEDSSDEAPLCPSENPGVRAPSKSVVKSLKFSPKKLSPLKTCPAEKEKASPAKVENQPPAQVMKVSSAKKLSPLKMGSAERFSPAKVLKESPAKVSVPPPSTSVSTVVGTALASLDNAPEPSVPGPSSSASEIAPESSAVHRLYNPAPPYHQNPSGNPQPQYHYPQETWNGYHPYPNGGPYHNNDPYHHNNGPYHHNNGPYHHYNHQGSGQTWYNL